MTVPRSFLDGDGLLYGPGTAAGGGNTRHLFLGCQRLVETRDRRMRISTIDACVPRLLADGHLDESDADQASKGQTAPSGSMHRDASSVRRRSCIEVGLFSSKYRHGGGVVVTVDPTKPVMEGGTPHPAWAEARAVLWFDREKDGSLPPLRDNGYFVSMEEAMSSVQALIQELGGEVSVSRQTHRDAPSGSFTAKFRIPVK